MTATRRILRINAPLPELSPVEAGLLWNFLENLSSQLWEAYEDELLDLERECESQEERARLLDAERYDSECDQEPPIARHTHNTSCFLKSRHGNVQLCRRKQHCTATSRRTSDADPEF